jgi:nucleotide-binding universal stress UspA family protein
MYTRILVPLDRSELAEQVLPYIRLLGKSLPLPIELLQVVDPSFSYMADFARGPLTDQSPSLAVSRAQDYLDRVAATLNEEGLTASARVSTVYGENPASEIICEGEKEPGTLIAMSTHGRSGLSRWALGSVTDKVLHATSNPLLIIRAGDQEIPPSEAKLGKVIIPLDGSLLSEQVLPYVAPLAKALGLKMSLTRVIPSALQYCSYMEYPAAEYENLSVNLHVQAMDYLKEVASRLRQQGIAEVEERLIFGHPPSSILDLVQVSPNSLVAMTTHGRSGVARLTLGSVTDRVVRYSAGPVLVVRAIEDSE